MQHEMSPKDKITSLGFMGSIKNRIAPHDPQKAASARAKPWLARHYGTLMLLAGVSWLWWQVAVSWVNAAPNEGEQLNVYQFKIIATHEQSPHFSAEMPDGAWVPLHWPVQQSMSFQRGARFYVWDEQQRKELVGCSATAEGRPMVGLPYEKIRIWRLSCPKMNIHFSREQVIEVFERDRRRQKNADLVLIGSVSVLLLSFSFVVYVKESRGYL